MIRRELSDCSQPGWMLIAQPVHARLAGEMASRWTDEPLASWPWREELLGAVYRHDDGWREWEERPEVDPQSGVPLDFLETPAEMSAPIWRRSIEAAAEIGPLAAWVVSGHFSALAERGIQSDDASDAKRRLVEPFLAEQSELRDEWFSQWREADPATRTAEAMQQSLRYLQMFDAISLWLCCAERTEPQTWTMPTGGRLELTPADGIRIIARPWPFEPPPLHLEASGRTVAAVAYPDADALAAAESGMRTVAWELWPPG